MFDEVIRRIADLRRNAQRLHGEHELKFTELFPDEFMLRNTEFPTISALIEASGFKVESKDDFTAIPEAEWDEHIRTHTRFSSWSEMMKVAGEEWVMRQMNLG